MKKTGQLLKEKREAAKLSLSEVALATKINPKILTAMEEGNDSALPAKTFLRGFLKSYAIFLKMDPEEVLRSYQEESGPPPQPQPVHEINKPQPAAAPQVERRQERRRMDDDNSSSLRAAAVIVIVLLIGVIIGVRELIEKYQREKTVESTAINVKPLEQPQVTPTTPTQAAPAPAPAPAPAATVEPPAPAKSAQNEMMVTPPPPAPALAPAPAPASAAVPAPAATPAAALKDAETKATQPAPPKPEPAKKEEAQPAAQSSNADPAAKKIKNEIILEALDKVDVKFQIKGETKRLSLGPTQVHTIYSDQPLTLDLSDGGAVNIILNGRERGVPGDLGKPKTVKIP